MSRDQSPERASKFIPTKTLADQVVEWLGESYREPYVYSESQVRWNLWEPQVNSFMKRFKTKRTEEHQWPYPVLLAFFIDHTKRHASGAKELSILLELLCSPFKRTVYFEPVKVKAEMWPIIESLNLEKLHFWNDLNSALNNDWSYVRWAPGCDGMIYLRYHNPISGSRVAGERNYFFPSGLDDDFAHRFTCTNPVYNERKASEWNVEAGQTVYKQMCGLIAQHLGVLITAGGNYFQFPSIGDDSFYQECKKTLQAESYGDRLIWDDAKHSVTAMPEYSDE
jgi:hypothetical protein